MAKVTNKSMVVTVGGTDYKLDLKSAEFHCDDADDGDLSLGEAAQGGSKVWTFKGTVFVDHAAGSLWRKMFDAPGSSGVLVYRPYGNTTASATQPHYSATVSLTLPNGRVMGGEADRDASRQTTDVEWPLDAGTAPMPVTS